MYIYIVELTVRERIPIMLKEKKRTEKKRQEKERKEKTRKEKKRKERKQKEKKGKTANKQISIQEFSEGFL